MSIRIRFTLIYNVILALTLTIFGIALFSIQSQTTLEALKSDIIQTSNNLGESVLRSSTPSASNNDKPSEMNPADSNPSASNPAESNTPKPNFPPPMSFQNFSSDKDFQQIPEREMVRVLDSSGNLVASPYGRSEDLLPLSAEGLETLQNKGEWWQTDLVKDQRMLIYSRPILAEDQVTYILQVARPLTERDNTLQSLGTTLVMASLVTLVVAFGIGWIFSGIVMKPIRHMTQTAKSIGEEGDLTRRVNYKGPQDEVGQLATTFNTMLARLQDSYLRVAHALELQRNFVADVSHELRTPLTTLRGNLELLRRTPPIPAEEQTDIQNDMVDESDRLIRLVNELLTLARADAAKNLKQEKIEALPVLQETIRQALQNYNGRHVSLDISENPRLLGDRDAFKQIILILLDNALKYSRDGINISALKQESRIEIRIRDYGKGLPPEKLEHIFDRFYRMEEDASIAGFGLGLAIAKSLVEAQGGEISMTSEEGEGSEVLLRFPFAE